MKRVSWDIETNGLLPDVDKLHSLVMKDMDTGSRWSASSQDPKDLKAALEELQATPFIVGHNIIGYDIPVLQHLYPWFNPRGVVRDTMILSKMIWPVDKLKDLDFPRWRSGKLPGQLIGAHKLEAWGYRLGRMKGEYSATVKELSKEYTKTGDLSLVPEWARCLASNDDKGRPILDPWLAWNQPMQDYCDQDVEVTEELFRLQEGHLQGTSKAAQGIGWSERSVELEHRVWKHCMKQTQRGFGFDRDEAVKLAGDLKTRQRELEAELVSVFGSWWQPQDDEKEGHRVARDYSEKMTQFPDITVKRFSEKTGKPLKDYVGPPLCHYTADAPFVRITRVTFNPKSRVHLGDRLQDLFGWQPVEFGGRNKDEAKVDETTIRALPESVIPESLKQTILEYLVVTKTLGALADGTKAWIDFCGDDGRIHGRVDPLGTITHRAAHFDPNLGQVTAVSVKEDKQPDGTVKKSIIWGWKGGFGAECRSLFKPGRPGWQQTGVDASGLQLRILGHYLYPFDDGAFSKRVCTPGLDIHSANSEITGLPRAETKTVTYAVIFGSGPLLVGMGVGLDGYDIQELANSAAAQNYVRFMRRVMRNKFVTPEPLTLAYIVRGQEVVKKFMDGITGLKDFKKESLEFSKQYGFLVAMDGRKLQVRKPHAAIVQLLQGGDAIICKEWQIETERLLREDHDLLEDRDYGQMGWIHDELQFEHREGLHEVIKEASEQAMRNVAESLQFRGVLTTEAKLGNNWRDCH